MVGVAFICCTFVAKIKCHLLYRNILFIYIPTCLTSDDQESMTDIVLAST